jgi:ComF family protein
MSGVGARERTMPLLHGLRRELAGLFELFFPPACPLCGVLLKRDGNPLFCSACLAGMKPVPSPRCPRCLLPYPAVDGHDHLCQDCLLNPPPFAAVTSVALYEDRLSQAVQRFKYRGTFSLDRPLGHLLADAMETGPAFSRPRLLVPVPLHVSRLRRRGYNQSLLLARVLGRRWRVPVSPRLLVRTRETIPQQGLKAAERRRNLKGAFRVRKPLEGETVLLVDDVMTTGATVRECSRVLLEAGAGRVEVAVLGRARLHGT